MKEHIVRLKAEICQRPALVRAYREDLAKLVAEKPADFDKAIISYPYKRFALRLKGRALCLAYAYARGKAYASLEAKTASIGTYYGHSLIQGIRDALNGTVTVDEIKAWMAPPVAVEVAA